MVGGFGMGGDEADLAHGMGVVAQEGVAGSAELAHEAELAIFEVFDAAPDEVGGGLAGATCEVRTVDDANAQALGAQAGCRDRAVDAPADDEDVELGAIELAEHVFALGCHPESGAYGSDGDDFFFADRGDGPFVDALVVADTGNAKTRLAAGGDEEIATITGELMVVIALVGREV